MPRKTIFALLLTCAFAAGVSAQTTSASSNEFGRGSGGELEVITKQGKRLYGSFGVSMSRSQLPFASGLNKGYSATLGGTIVEDRLWFFASAQQTPMISSMISSALPQSAVRNIDSKLTAQLGDRQSLSGSFASVQGAPSPLAFTAADSRFLSLRYTGVISSNMFFNASFSQSSVSQKP